MSLYTIQVLAILGSIAGLLGTLLGILNLAYQVHGKRRRVKVEVFKSAGIGTGPFEPPATGNGIAVTVTNVGQVRVQIASLMIEFWPKGMRGWLIKSSRKHGFSLDFLSEISNCKLEQGEKKQVFVDKYTIENFRPPEYKGLKMYMVAQDTYGRKHYSKELV